MDMIQRLIDSIRSHMPAYLRRDTTAAEKDQQAVASTTSHG